MSLTFANGGAAAAAEPGLAAAAEPGLAAGALVVGAGAVSPDDPP